MKLTIASLIITIAAVAALGTGSDAADCYGRSQLAVRAVLWKCEGQTASGQAGHQSAAVRYHPRQRLFTQEQYIDFLNRMPDQSGFQFWLNQITNCGANNPGCTEVMRINVSASFFLSIEFTETGYLAERTYKSAFGDASGVSDIQRKPQYRRAENPVQRVSDRYQSDWKWRRRAGAGLGSESWRQTKLPTLTHSCNAQALPPPTLLECRRHSLSIPLNSNAGNPLSQGERDQLVS